MSLIALLDEAVMKSTALVKGVAMGQFGGDSPDSRKISRRFGIGEAAEMIGVSKTAIVKAEEEGRLPAPDMVESNGRARVTRRAGYTINQIDNMRTVFKKHPWRAEGEDAVVVSIDGNKGGCFKTATNVHLAQWLSMAGYRVLLIDIDQQAHASMYFGYIPDLHVTGDDTVLPWMLGQRDDLSYAVKPTAWPNLEIIPSCLAMQALEQQMPDAELPVAEHLMLRTGIETIMDNYDVVLIDGHPDLGLGTINQICASDIILVATSAELNDYMSSVQYFTAVRDVLRDLDLGGFEPTLKVLLTKLGNPGSSSRWMEEQIRNQLGGLVLGGGIAITDEVGKGQLRMMTMFEQDQEHRSTISAWRRGLGVYEGVFNEILHQLIWKKWPSKWEVKP